MEHARSQISLIVGLGNPGLEYAFTRHNMGFMTVGRLLNKLNNGFESYSRYNSEIFQWPLPWSPFTVAVAANIHELQW